jgi:predicted ATPase/DNA-binding SARP family transcriptional activator/tetratricopeptide (TPR) repeat protein
MSGAEFGLLGPLEVVVAGAGRRPPTGAERALLAVLLLNAGRLVPASTLMDALWGDDPPANAANALQGRVSRLRRSLADAGVPGDPLVTRRPGYLLDVDPDGVDVHRFTRLVTGARQLVARGAATDAAALYDEALGLWRGDPLADIDSGPWVRAETVRLTELWLSAVEDRTELRLAGGGHTHLVPELEDLTARHPLRERLHSQLMLALYRSGRQADALDAYRRLRRTLDDELGLQPSAELRALEQAILRQDASLTAPATTPATNGRPATGPGDEPRSNLPIRLTSFVGRHSELAELRDLLRRHRLVTLTGPGGAGKTSLAIEALADDHLGVRLVRLADVTEPARVPRAVADALGVPEGDGPVEQRLVGYLRDHDVVLLLDNCEHVVDAAAALAETLLTRCPGLRLVATSREPLAVPGEVQLAVPPLPTPPPEATPDDVAGYESVQLFVDRARAVLGPFRLDPETAPHVAEICRRLDGIPLAVELAAARVKTMPVHELADRLTDRFRLLTGGPRTAAARQRTLRATVDWSHQLLTPQQRTVFRRLSVFRGGWDVEAAERVCAGAGIDVVNLLAELVDRSLVVADRDTTGRLRMLETLRQYAGERLAEAAETDTVGAAHATHYAAIVERAEPQLRGPRQADWLAWLDTERDNVRAALDWCRRHGDTHPDLGLNLVGGLGWFWYFASNTDGHHDIAAVLASTASGSAGARAHALQGHSVAARPRSCIVHPNAACAASAEQSARLFDDAHRRALSTTLLAVEGISGHAVDASHRMLAAADDEFVGAGDEWGRALVLFVRLELSAAAGDLDAAAAHAESSLGLFRRLDDHWGVSAVQYHLGMALHRAGLVDRALDTYRAALAEARRAGPANTVQYVLANMGHAALLNLDADRAGQLFAEADAVARRLGAEGNPLAALGIGLLARLRGDLPDAARRLADALDGVTGSAGTDWAAIAGAGLGFVAEASGRLDAAEEHHRAAWELGLDAGRAGDAAVAVAIDGLACVAAARDDGSAAVALLARAARWRAERRRPAAPLERRDIDRAVDRVRSLLGADRYTAAFDAAYAAGTPAPPP